MRYNRNILIVVLLNFFLTSTVLGAIPAWDKTFGGTGSDSAASVIQNQNGEYVIAGTSSSYGAGGYDAWLIITDSKGNWLWDKSFGGRNNDLAASVIQTSDDGYMIAGTTSSYGAGGSDVWLVKTNSKGNCCGTKPLEVKATIWQPQLYKLLMADILSQELHRPTAQEVLMSG
ncbi:exported hypothetical protein [Candidatus Methanoperedens nitroreducens]|uniref:Uncharacterized protein n=1 Tax=Candidatus Methanoperedens nitratireducens TaxID=1392998 RepID=A0A284VQL8_9EURY|nr:exported hypothetical protein [Candidatus Methanoperedens nitroreducens]